MKKWGIAAVFAFVLLLVQGAALAELTALYPATENAAGLSFDEKNVLHYHSSHEHRPQFTDDREPMFRWMEMNTEAQSTVMVCMPEGRVLGNVYRTEMGISLTAEELATVWPLMAERLERLTAYVDSNPSCAMVQTRDGVDWLHIQTLVVLDGEKMLALDLEGFINCDDGIMKEIWLASPTQATYLYDEKAAEELAADKEIARNWLESMTLIPPVGGQ